MMRRLLTTSVLIVSSSALITGLTGCSANPENSPAIQKKFSQVDELQENLDDNNQMLRTITSDLAILKDQLSNMRAMDPESEAGQELLSRLNLIESQVGSIEAGSERVISQIAANNTSSGNTSFDGLAVPPSAQSNTSIPATTATSSRVDRPDRLFPPDQRETRAPRTPTQSSTASSSGTSSSSATPSIPKPATTTSTSTASRGRYYTLKSGETLETVAQSNGITVSKLREENRIPSGARVLKGQRIYIPGS